MATQKPGLCKSEQKSCLRHRKDQGLSSDHDMYNSHLKPRITICTFDFLYNANSGIITDCWFDQAPFELQCPTLASDHHIPPDLVQHSKDSLCKENNVSLELEPFHP